MHFRRLTIFCLCLFGNLPVLLLAEANLSRIHHWVMGQREVLGVDFATFWSGGRLMLAGGHLDRLYDFQAFNAFERTIFGPLDPHSYSYPPHSLLIMAPFAWLPYPLAWMCWTGLGLVLFVLAARPMLREAGLPPVLAILTPAAGINLWCGQFGFLIGAGWLWAFRGLERRPSRGALAVALLTVKPHMAILLPLVVIRRRRRWTAFAAAGTAAIGCFALGIGLFGIELTRHWLTGTGPFLASLIHAHFQLFHALMVSTVVPLAQQPLTAPFASVAQSLTALAAIVLMWRAAGCDVPIDALCLPTATATFLVLPYAFDYDMTVAALGLMITLYQRWDDVAVWERAGLAMGALVPQACMIFAIAGLPLTPFITLGALIVQLRAERLMPAIATPNGVAMARSLRHAWHRGS